MLLNNQILMCIKENNRKKLESHTILYIKSNSQWIIGQNIKVKQQHFRNETHQFSPHAGGNTKPVLWEILAASYKAKILHDPAILFLSIYSTDSKINIYTDLLMNVYKGFICNHQNVPQ